MKQIPNLFTLLNLFFGCLAIVAALQTQSVNIYVNDEFSGSSFSLPESLAMAGLFIMAGAVVDFLDGFVARLFKATSAMGAQLDSLADVVTFGVAPAAILYQLLRLSYAKEEFGLEVSAVWLWPAFILSCAAAYRLAKFNLDTAQSYDFKGMPTPAVGLLIASFPLIMHNNFSLVSITEWLGNKWLLYGLVVVLSYLMLSDIRFMGMKFKDYSFKNNIPKVILISIGLISAFFLQWIAVPVVFVCYILLSLINKKQIT